jgi:ribosomal protein S1
MLAARARSKSKPSSRKTKRQRGVKSRRPEMIYAPGEIRRLSVGQELSGRVDRIESKQVVVDLGEGIWGTLTPNPRLQVGQSLTVEIISISPRRGKIMAQLLWKEDVPDEAEQIAES